MSVSLHLYNQGGVKEFLCIQFSHLLHGSLEIDRDKVFKALGLVPSVWLGFWHSWYAKEYYLSLLSSLASSVLNFIFVSLI